MKIVTICGSTQFKTQINNANRNLTLAGFIAISLGLFGHTELPDYNWDTDATDLKTKLDLIHFQKIEMADAILVVNPHRPGDNPGGAGYWGESTAREIRHAQSRGIPVAYSSNGIGEIRKYLQRLGTWSIEDEEMFMSRPIELEVSMR